MHWAGHALLGAPLRTAVTGEGRLEHIKQETGGAGGGGVALIQQLQNVMEEERSAYYECCFWLPCRCRQHFGRGRTGIAVVNSSESEEDRKDGVVEITSSAEEVEAYSVSFTVCCEQYEHIKEAAELECTWCGLNVCYEDWLCYRSFQSSLQCIVCDPDPALDAASDQHRFTDGSFGTTGGSTDDIILIHSYNNDMRRGYQGTATMAHNSTGQLNVSGTRAACDPDPALDTAADPVGKDEHGYTDNVRGGGNFVRKAMSSGAAEPSAARSCAAAGPRAAVAPPQQQVALVAAGAPDQPTSTTLPHPPLLATAIQEPSAPTTPSVPTREAQGSTSGELRTAAAELSAFPAQPPDSTIDAGTGSCMLQGGRFMWNSNFANELLHRSCAMAIDVSFIFLIFVKPPCGDLNVWCPYYGLLVCGMDIYY